jgi:hypothetical protein
LAFLVHSRAEALYTKEPTSKGGLEMRASSKVAFWSFFIGSFMMCDLLVLPTITAILTFVWKIPYSNFWQPAFLAYCAGGSLCALFFAALAMTYCFPSNDDLREQTNVGQRMMILSNPAGWLIVIVVQVVQWYVAACSRKERPALRQKNDKK